MRRTYDPEIPTTLALIVLFLDGLASTAGSIVGLPAPCIILLLHMQNSQRISVRPSFAQ